MSTFTVLGTHNGSQKNAGDLVPTVRVTIFLFPERVNTKFCHCSKRHHHTYYTYIRVNHAAIGPLVVKIMV